MKVVLSNLTFQSLCYITAEKTSMDQYFNSSLCWLGLVLHWSAPCSPAGSNT